MTKVQIFPADALRKFVTEVFIESGVEVSQAVDATDVLMWASLRGVDTHGIRNLKALYIDPILQGQVNLKSSLRIEQETAITTRADGDLGLGLSMSCDAMRIAIAKAETSGIGIVNVRNSHHLGAAGYFASMAIERGQLGVCLSGEFFGGRAGMGIAPINSLQPLFSSNPISVAAPCDRYAPYVFDMSTTVVPINRVERFGCLEQAIPLGWARDATGQPTTDPSLAHIMEPLGGRAELGGHKGVGLAMMVSILSAVLSDAWTPTPGDAGNQVFRQNSKAHFFAALRIDQFMPLQAFCSAIDAMIETIQSASREQEGEPIHYPGSQEAQTELERGRDGIPLIASEVDDLVHLGKLFNVALPQ